MAGCSSANAAAIGDRPAGDHPAVIDDVACGDQLVQRRQRRDRGDGDQVAAAEPADLAFDPALLVRAFLARRAEERVVPVMGAQRDEPLGLGPVPAAQHPHHGGLEVVIADPAGHRAEVLKGQHVAFQERFLRLGGERDVERPARARQPHHEHPQLHQRSRR